MLVSGLLSGIDWEELVDQLMQIERRPLQLLQSRQAHAQSLNSTWNEIKGLVTAVRDAAKALRDASLLQRYGVRSSDAEAVTGTADDSAVAGTYEVTVQQLAQAHAVASTQQFTGTVGLTGTFILSGDGGSTWVSIDVATTDTLADIARKINDAYEQARAADPGFIGVKATVIDGRLVLTRSATGDVSIGIGGDTALLQGLGLQNPNELRAGADAVLTINGLTVTSPSNRVTAVQGLTIELFAAGKTVTLTVERDRATVEGEINKFINAYNKLVQALGTYTAREGKLQGDSTAVNLLSALRSRTGGKYTVDGQAVSLAAIGIGTDGQSPALRFDAGAFWQAYDQDPSRVEGLLAAAGTELEAYLDVYVRTDGIIETRTEGLDARIKDLQASVERMEARLETRRANLMRQYQALEALMARLSAQGNWLAMQTQSLAALSQRGGSR